MALIDRSQQAIIKDANSVLVGVAQIRVGQPSLRIATTVAQATTLTAVCQSSKVISSTVATEIVVAPSYPSVANTGAAASLSVAGTYSGKVDGAYIFRAVNAATGKVAESNSATTATKIEVFDVYGYLCHTTTSLAVFGVMTASFGLTFSAATFTGALAGDTWILPVYSTAAQTKSQTGIVCPFSTLTATDSVGGLKSSGFSAKVDGIKKLTSGFPEIVSDQVISGVSADIEWSGFEYLNQKTSLLKKMMADVINSGNLGAVPIEMIARSRGGQAVRIWVPTATFTAFPKVSPTTDYSDISFQFSTIKQTTVTPNLANGGTDINNSAGIDALTVDKVITYNAWLSDSPLFSENLYA